MGEKIQLDIQENFAWIWLKDSKGLNLMGPHFFNELESALDEIETHKGLRGVIFATEAKNFSMGLDLKESAASTPKELIKVPRQAGKVFNRIAELSFPTLSIFRGYSVGGALELAVGCDFRIATQDTQISLPAIKIGFFNPAGTCFRLPKLIGLARAKDLMLTARLIDAQTALHWGLISEIIKTEEIISKGKQWAQMIASLEARSLQATKYLLDIGIETDLKSFLKIEDKELEACFLRDEPIELMKKFLKK
jgi:enoyl-CoA hydratase